LLRARTARGKKIEHVVDHLKDAADFRRDTARQRQWKNWRQLLPCWRNNPVALRNASPLASASWRDGTAKARETADGISQTLRVSLQDISMLSGQISGHARSVNEQVGEQRESLKALMSEAEDKSNRMQSLLRTQESELTASIQGMESRIEEIGQKFVEKGQTVFARFGNWIHRFVS
jgi:hypothetical protein